MSGMLRAATEGDWPEILLCHARLEAKLGKSMDLPLFHDRAVLAWFVYERGGEVVQFAYLEKAVEVCLGGEDVEALQAFIAEAPGILHSTRAAGVRFVHCFVPHEVKESIGRHLQAAGFEPNPHTPFHADLR